MLSANPAATISTNVIIARTAGPIPLRFSCGGGALTDR